MDSPKILIFDIETVPNLIWAWGIYEQNSVKIEKESVILSWSAKWFGKRGIIHRSIKDYKGYKPGIHLDKNDEDRGLMKELWELMNQADIIIGQNSDNFDIRKVNTRFLFYRLPPVKPFKSIDTKKIFSKHFWFNSNGLDYVSNFLGEGKKVDHPNDMWYQCITSPADAPIWKKLKKYNNRDVYLTDRDYIRVRPFAKNHPNLNLYTKDFVCPRCKSDDLQKRGFDYKNRRVYQQFYCKSCGHWPAAPTAEPIKENLLV